MTRTIHAVIIDNQIHTDNVASNSFAEHCRALARSGDYDVFLPVELYTPTNPHWIIRLRTLADGVTQRRAPRRKAQ
jgi:hypothetical protein